MVSMVQGGVRNDITEFGGDGIGSNGDEGCFSKDVVMMVVIVKRGRNNGDCGDRGSSGSGGDGISKDIEMVEVVVMMLELVLIVTVMW